MKDNTRSRWEKIREREVVVNILVTVVTELCQIFKKDYFWCYAIE
ncbi:MAG: hypothetical protein WC294_07430 [Methanoregula sp.]